MNRKQGAHRGQAGDERTLVGNEPMPNFPSAVEQTVAVVPEKSRLRRYARRAVGFLALATAVSFAAYEVVNDLSLSSAAGRAVAGAEQTPGAIVPSVEATTASASASASASTSPSALPPAVKSSAVPTHEVVVAAPTTHAAPSVKPKPTTASPSPVHTTPRPEAKCWTAPSSPDPIIECSPAVTPVDIAGSKGYESNLTISANSTNVHVNLSDVITVGGTNYVEVYDPAQANNGTGWILEADLAGQH